jgi:PAS domain S-box-containing protein
MDTPANPLAMLRITLIESGQQTLQPLYLALKRQGYTPRLWPDAETAAIHLAQTDLLIIDAALAGQPKSSHFIKAPRLVVVGPAGHEPLPPWLEAAHVHQLPLVQPPNTLVESLAHLIAPFYQENPPQSPAPEHLALLFNITQTLSGQLDIEQLLERVVAQAPLLGGHFAAVLIQEDDDTLHYRSSQPGREELTGPTGHRFALRLLAEGLEGHVIRQNLPALVPDTWRDKRWFRASYLPEDRYSVAALPIPVERIEAGGMFLVAHTKPGHFTAEHLPLLEMAVRQMGRAIETALLFKNQSERSVQLSLINEVGQAATSILNLEVMLRTVVQAIRRNFGFHSVAVHLRHAALAQVELRARVTPTDHGPIPPETVVAHKFNEGLVGWAAANRAAILANDVARASRHRPTGLNKDIRAQLCVPITLGVKLIGVLDLQSTRLEAFDKYHVSALEMLAAQLAIAIENAQLYEEKLKTIERLDETQHQNEQLFQQAEQLRAFNEDIIQHMTNGLIAIDAAGLITAFNPAAACMLGSHAAAVLNRPLPLALYKAKELISIFEDTLRTGQAHPHREITVVHPTGQSLPLSLSTAPLGGRGRGSGVVGVLEDLSQAKALEAERRRLDRLVVLGEMSAVVAHEIRNPIAGIAAGLEYLTRNLGPDSPDMAGVNLVKGEIERVNRILEDILFVARPLALSPSKESLPEIVRSVVQRFNPGLAEHRIKVSIQAAPNLPLLKVDRQRLEQVFNNLVLNAIQAMPQGGELAIGLQPNPPAGGIAVTVRDTGPGITPDVEARLFEPFFTTKAKGTGLGLTVASRIIEEHGGHIQVNYQPGQGTQFTIHLPAEDTPQP